MKTKRQQKVCMKMQLPAYKLKHHYLHKNHNDRTYLKLILGKRKIKKKEKKVSLAFKLYFRAKVNHACELQNSKYGQKNTVHVRCKVIDSILNERNTDTNLIIVNKHSRP
jgi:hypothetical protein